MIISFPKFSFSWFKIELSTTLIGVSIIILSYGAPSKYPLIKSLLIISMFWISNSLIFSLKRSHSSLSDSMAITSEHRFDNKTVNNKD